MIILLSVGERNSLVRVHTQHYHIIKGDNRKTEVPPMQSEPRIAQHTNGNIFPQLVASALNLVQLFKLKKLQQWHKYNIKLFLRLLISRISKGYP